jgi:hypothetical protein
MSTMLFNDTGTIVKRNTGTGYQAFTFNYYPSTFNSWSTVTPLQNSWVAYNTSTHPIPQCYKGSDDVVVVRGLIKRSSGTGTIVGNLPTSCGLYADGRQIFLGMYQAEEPARIDIYAANGDNTYPFTINALTNSSTYTSMDNIRFIAD